MMKHFSIAALLLLSACGFQPLYGSAVQSHANLSQVALDEMPERDGQKLSWLLSDRFYGAQTRAASTPWHLSVLVKTDKQELGIREDDVATRARLTLTAKFTLKNTNTDQTYEGSERSFVSYNIYVNPYATLTADEDAKDRGLRELADKLTNRIALHLAGQKKP